MDGNVGDVFKTFSHGSKYIVLDAWGTLNMGISNPYYTHCLNVANHIFRFYAFVTYACCYSAMLNNEMICDTQCVEGDWDVILIKN